MPWAHLDIAGHGLELARPAAGRQGCHRLRRPPARPAGRRQARSRPLDRGRLLPPDPEHRSTRRCRGCWRRPMPPATACVRARRRSRSGWSCSTGPCGPTPRTPSCRTARASDGFAEEQPIYLTAQVENPNGADHPGPGRRCRGPRPGLVRPLPRPVRRRRPRSGRPRPRALARGPGGRATAAPTGSRASAAAGPGALTPPRRAYRRAASPPL